MTHKAKLKNLHYGDVEELADTFCYIAQNDALRSANASYSLGCLDEFQSTGARFKA